MGLLGEHRVCCDCLVSKPIDLFYKIRKRSGTYSRRKYCSACSRLRVNLWDETNKERKKLRTKNSDLRKNYGITLSDLEDLLDEFGYECAICRKSIGVHGNKTEVAHVDHDHGSGVIRGLLCLNCNCALGQFGDSVDNLESAIRYLRSAGDRIRLAQERIELQDADLIA